MALKSNVKQVHDLLLRERVVDEFQMRSAMAHLEQWGGRLPAVVTEMGFVDGQFVAEVLARALRLPLIRLETAPRDGGALGRLEAAYCEENAIFPVSLKERVLTLAMADPTELDLADNVASKAGARVKVVVASEAEILRAISRHYHGKELPTRVSRARQAITSDVPFARPGEVELEHVENQRPASANTLLDEMLEDDAPPKSGFSPDDLARLQSLQENQYKTATALRAVHALLVEKGVLR